MCDCASAWCDTVLLQYTLELGGRLVDVRPVGGRRVDVRRVLPPQFLLLVLARRAEAMVRRREDVKREGTHGWMRKSKAG